jgi:hypothetical protein
MTATVTGRTYTQTRARGLAPWNPQARTVELLGQVSAVLDEYRAHLPLTARQIFYRLVGHHGYDKTEAAYSRLLEALNRARRAGLIPWNALRDDGTVAELPDGWTGPEAFWRAVQATADNYRHQLADGQPVAVELWVEAAGMVPQVARVAEDYGLPVYSAGGFNSVTEKHAAALRMVRRSTSTIVLHLGDHDPSGCAIVDSAADDIEAFCADYGRPDAVRFYRVAVTPDQIEHYDLPTAPQKHTDRRGEEMAETVQAEALAPDELAAELREAIEEVVDLDLIEDARRLGETERDGILDGLRDLA